MKITKPVTLILCLVIGLCMIAGCSAGAPSDTSDTPGGAVTADSNGDAGEISADVNADILAAIENAKWLTGQPILRLESGAFITADKFLVDDLLPYSQMSIAKLACTAGADTVLALTTAGELYRGEERIADSVKDVVVRTNNVNQSGYYIGQGTVIRKFFITDEIDPYDCRIYPKTAGIFYTVMEKSYLGLVGTDGSVFIYDDWSKPLTESYPDYDTSSWDDVAVLGISLHFHENAKQSFTIAGLKRDGSLIAMGDYAEEILSWGKLSYISMSGEYIVGLTPDGTLKLGGKFGDILKEKEPGIAGLTGVKAIFAREDYLFILTEDNVLHYVKFDLIMGSLYYTYELSENSDWYYKAENGVAYLFENGVGKIYQ